MPSSAIAFGRSLPNATTMTDEEFLTRLVFDTSAPKRLVALAHAGDVTGFSKHLQKHLEKRGQLGKSKRASSGAPPRPGMLWSRHAFDESKRTSRLFALYESLTGGEKRGGTKIKKKKTAARSRNAAAKKVRIADRESACTSLARWIDDADARHPLSPLEVLVLLDLLSAASALASAEILFSLWKLTLLASMEITDDSHRSTSNSSSADQKLLIRGELPWRAGLFFSMIEGADELSTRAEEILCEDLLESTDTEGTPSAELIDRLSFWLAPLIRSEDWARRFGTTVWDDEAEDRFELLMEAACSICRTDGRLALSNGFRQNALGLLSVGSRLTGGKKKSRSVRYLCEVEEQLSRPKNGKVVKSSQPKLKRSAYPVRQSDWARLACLRNHWSFHADTLVIAHHEPLPKIDLTILGQPLFSGAWELDVKQNGRPIRIKADWECACWFSDPDADFLELSANFDGQMRIDRQILLSRKDHLLLLADVVSAKDGVPIEYESRLPIVSGTKCKADRMTRECTLKSGGVSARVFPLALPTERVHSAAGGSCLVDSNCLTLQQRGVGGLYAPLAIDWAPQRRTSYADWRTLTVTESGRILEPHAAAGHRIRTGDQQWLIYRNLKNTDEMRACLGHHTAHETVIGKIDSNGNVDPIVLVES